MPGLRQRLIVVSSPSKAYNIATLDCCWAAIPDESLRAAYRTAGLDQAEVFSMCLHSKLLSFLSIILVCVRARLCVAHAERARSLQVPPFGYAGALAAYGHAGSAVWHGQMVEYIRANREYALDVLQEASGGRAAATCPEASYLMWVDVSGALPLPANGHATATSYFEAHGVGFSEGTDVRHTTTMPPLCRRRHTAAATPPPHRRHTSWPPQEHQFLGHALRLMRPCLSYRISTCTCNALRLTRLPPPPPPSPGSLVRRRHTFGSTSPPRARPCSSDSSGCATACEQRSSHRCQP